MMKPKGNINSERFKKLCFIFTIAAIFFACSFDISAQNSDGSTSPQKSSTSEKADQNLRSIAHVNPSTLAMEFSLPLMSYPGRGGNSVPVNLSYSSKLWEMKAAQTWWYPFPSNSRKYVTDTYARYAEQSAAGWSSSLIPPRINTKFETYNINGNPYGDSLDVTDFNSNIGTALGE